MTLEDDLLLGTLSLVQCALPWFVVPSGSFSLHWPPRLWSQMKTTASPAQPFDYLSLLWHQLKAYLSAVDEEVVSEASFICAFLFVPGKVGESSVRVQWTSQSRRELCKSLPWAPKSNSFLNATLNVWFLCKSTCLVFFFSLLKKAFSVTQEEI